MTALWFGLAAFGLLVVGFELVAARRAGRVVYPLAPTLSNLGCGLLRGAVALGMQGLLLGVYAAVHARFGLLSLAELGPAGWLCAFIAYDFAYYWVHRLSHAVPVLWAAHAVHHQPTELDASVLLRAPVVAPIQAFPIYLLLAVLGVSPAMYVALAVLEHGLMVWLHTRFVPDLGAFGWLLDTPSHHRVHHAKGARANYGGVLIVWDRLFGTFVPERGELEFGIAGQPPPLGPVRANLAPWIELWRGRDEPRQACATRESDTQTKRARA